MSRDDHASVVDAWVELAATMTIRDIADAELPRAGLGSGAAGVAYVLGRIGRARNDASVIAASRRWFGITQRAANHRDGFRARGWPTCSHSAMYGPIGHAAAAVLVTPTPATIRAYVVRAKQRVGSAPAEYTFGLAGNVLTTLAVARATGSPEAAALARELATRLAKLQPPSEGGFAHGDIGVVTARIVAAESRAPAAPGLEALAATEPTEVLARTERLRRSWCSGLSGYAIAWVRAAEHAGNERCRGNALAAGTLLLDELDVDGGSICCGLGGRVYALLAIARLDPGGPWIDHATRLARRALAHPLPNGGILRGLPGLVALADALRDPATARFPFVDVI